MQKEFSLSDGKAMINFTAKYCDTAEKLFDSNGFKKVLNTYRKVEENVLGVKPKVYRQLPAGGNAGLILNNVKWNNKEAYALLKDIPFIEFIKKGIKLGEIRTKLGINNMEK